MLIQLNAIALIEYSNQFAKMILERFYAENDYLEGNHIPTLTPVGQVNLLVVYALYEQWRTETENFRSRFFDFEHQAVKQVLELFMNTVSQHIKVAQEDIQPILAQAVYDSLQLLLLPQQYFTEQYRAQPQLMVKRELVEQQQKYLRFHQYIPNHIMTMMGDMTQIPANEAIDWTDQICTQQSENPEDVAHWVSVYSSVLPLKETTIVKRFPANSYFDAISTEIDAAMSIDYKHKVTSEDTHNGHLIHKKTTTDVQVAMPTNQADNIAETHSMTYMADTPTPADTPLIAETPAIEEVPIIKPIQHTPVQSLTQGIPLHQKFLFIQELFGGSVSQFEMSIEELEESSNYQTANDLLTNQYAVKYKWNLQSETFSDFSNLIKRRFLSAN